MVTKDIRRGQVWFYRPTVTPSGHIQKGARPVVIVSNDHLNRSSDVVLAVPCTSQIKRNFPTHTLFIMDGTVSVALTEQVGPVNTDELVNCIYTLEAYIMEQIDEALKISLGLADVVINRPSEPSTNYSRPVDRPNADRKPRGSQTDKFYARYSNIKQDEPEKEEESGKGKWTTSKMQQLIEDYEAASEFQLLSVANKYSLSMSTLKQYYRKFKALV